MVAPALPFCSVAVSIRAVRFFDIRGKNEIGGIYMNRIISAALLTLSLTTPVFAGAKVAPVAGSPAPAATAASDTSSRMVELQPGVYFYKTTYTGQNGLPTKLYVYMPKVRKSDVPAVVIAAAGAPAFAGSSLGEGDQPEHIPYVQAGFIVVAYETDGVYDEKTPGGGMISSAKKFKAADAGIKNGRSAVEYASRLTGVKEDCIFTAGHSSAATIALRVAQVDPHVKACVAYAPPTDIVSHLEGAMRLLDAAIPNYSAFAESRSPITFAPGLRTPTLVFQADDDDRVPKAETEAFVKAAQAAKKNLTYKTTATGGHYDSMINEGIPQGIAFLKKQPCCSKN
jgi:dipeptidyl aminopeptidase/acylaminoacyl peptidase